MLTQTNKTKRKPTEQRNYLYLKIKKVKLYKMYIQKSNAFAVF